MKNTPRFREDVSETAQSKVKSEYFLPFPKKGRVIEKHVLQKAIFECRKLFLTGFK